MLSGGGVAFAHNAEGAFQYLKRTCNGTTPDDILRKMADEMVGMIDWLTELAKVSGTEPTKTETRGHGTYPFPGTNDIDSIKLKDFQAYSEFPWAKGLRGGARLFKVVYDNVNARMIEVMLSTPAKELITGKDGVFRCSLGSGVSLVTITLEPPRGYVLSRDRAWPVVLDVESGDSQRVELRIVRSK